MPFPLIEAKKMQEVYANFAENYMAMPVVKGVKSASERFAGALDTYTIEAMMQDGKALQAGTSHFLGQNFGKAFDVTFIDKEGKSDYAWATSWGVSTRLIGALIMSHSDDNGLVLPPHLAPIQVVIIPIYRNDEQLAQISEKVSGIVAKLKKMGISVKFDDADNKKPGWKFAEYELKGVPVRLAMGGRDLENNTIEVMRRDTLEKVYAHIFHAEDALVRPHITCGTHALTIALSGNLRPGDELLSPVGKPYDTLEGVIGIRPQTGSLAEYGVTYRQVDLLPNGDFDFENIRKAINEKTKLVEIQRSKGYMTRPSFSVKQIGELIAFVKSIKPDVICMVDNCYGEFVDTIEPSDVGADMVVGSLIKNPGGGLAPIGGYIAGTKECVENASYRMTCPGLGAEVGASLGVNRSFYQGFFLAPMVTKGALKGAVFAANIYEKLGFDVVPNSTEPRQDIIQAVTLKSPERLIAFCKGIQAAAPVDSYVDPEPWDMPGYDSQVIMAAGAFVQGSSIELSADGPVKEPYAVYFQGGLTWEHAKLGVMMSLQKLVEQDLVKLQ